MSPWLRNAQTRLFVFYAIVAKWLRTLWLPIGIVVILVGTLVALWVTAFRSYSACVETCAPDALFEEHRPDGCLCAEDGVPPYYKSKETD